LRVEFVLLITGQLEAEDHDLLFQATEHIHRLVERDGSCVEQLAKILDIGEFAGVCERGGSPLRLSL
jgi:hypothetical protein